MIAAMTRQAVGDDATSPNRSGCSRSTARSAKESPPSATLAIISRTTRPGSWAVHPSVSASSVRAALHRMAGIPAPSVVTMSVLRRLVGFALGGALLGWVLERVAPPVSNSREPLFYHSSRVAACLTETSRLIAGGGVTLESNYPAHENDRGEDQAYDADHYFDPARYSKRGERGDE